MLSIIGSIEVKPKPVHRNCMGVAKKGGNGVVTETHAQADFIKTMRRKKRRLRVPPNQHHHDCHCCHHCHQEPEQNGRDGQSKHDRDGQSRQEAKDQKEPEPKQNDRDGQLKHVDLDVNGERERNPNSPLVSCGTIR